MPPQVINLVDYDDEDEEEVINLVDHHDDDNVEEENVSWLPKKNIGETSAHRFRVDDNSTIASRSTMGHLDQNLIQLPLYDAMMCTAATLLEQSREEEESPYIVHSNKQLRYVEDREEAEMYFDCASDPRELWFGCLLDAAGEAAEFLGEGLVGASNRGHERATNRLLERRKRLDTGNNRVHPDIPEIVDVCDIQDQEEQEEARLSHQKHQKDMEMLLPEKKKDPPTKQELEEATFPLLEIHVPDTIEEEDENKKDDDDMSKL
ncbi:unnamed protein product [Cylindrotheca closterium]|uniref:Uncharacterized protein n=1 Tax=Cylindrotheca closterium TaxID=2856 RepID=A0AAD2FMT2_9STRA|nr:unnamed protein product [Cylindrotheca closterium]